MTRLGLQSWPCFARAKPLQGDAQPLSPQPRQYALQWGLSGEPDTDQWPLKGIGLSHEIPPLDR